MNEGSVYQRKDKRWVAQWKDSQGKTQYLYRKTKSEARAALRQVLKDRDEGIVPVGKMTLNDLLDSWLEDMDGTVSRRTIVHRESIFRVHIKPTIGTVLESEISINLLDLLDEDDVPQNSDVVLTLSQYVAAMEQFRSTYHGWSGSKHRWFTE